MSLFTYLSKSFRSQNVYKKRLYNTRNVSDKMNDLLYNARYRSRQRVLKGRKESGQFEIDLDTLLLKQNEQDNKCAYTNAKLDWNLNGYYGVSIDRIDPNKGYIPDNIQLVQWGANYMKMDIPEDIFLEFIENIYLNKFKHKYQNKYYLSRR